MSATGWSHPAYDALSHLIARRAGLVFHEARRGEAEAGIRRAMESAGASDVALYLEGIEKGLHDIDALVSELTVTESYFFREPAHFDFIRDEVVPSFLPAGPRDRGLRVWSAGCASGEEPYSLAILFEEAGLAERPHILATDISRPALTRARAASYGTWSLRSVDFSRAARWFQSIGDRQVVLPRIRDQVRFQELNLALDGYPSFANGTWGMDIILCRNVLMYLSRPAIDAVARRLCASLAPGGWLITGPSDPPLPANGLLESVVTSAGVFYRRGDAAPCLPEIRPMVEPRPACDAILSRRASTDDEMRTSGADRLAEEAVDLAIAEHSGCLDRSWSVEDARSAALAIRRVANSVGSEAAERLAMAGATRHPFSVELHLLHAIFLADLGRHEEAVQALRRSLYLDRTLVVGHFLLGVALVRLTDRTGACRAFRNARELCARLPADAEVPFSDGLRAGDMAAAAASQMDAMAVGNPS